VCIGLKDGVFRKDTVDPVLIREEISDFIVREEGGWFRGAVVGHAKQSQVYYNEGNGNALFYDLLHSAHIEQSQSRCCCHEDAGVPGRDFFRMTHLDGNGEESADAFL